jgi:hypothetical protein
MPSFGVGAADQYLAIIDTVVTFSVVYPNPSLGAMILESGLAASTSVNLARVEFDLRVHYSINGSIIQSYASLVCDWSARQGHKTYPPHNPSLPHQ